MLKDKKYKFARDFNNMSAKTFFGSVFGIPLIAAISTASLITDTTPKYSLDSFSTSDTAVKVEYLEKEMDKINTDFIDSKERLDEIDAIKFAQGSDAVEQLYIEHEQSVEEITADFEEFRYDLFATGISEEAIQDISVTFNNLPVSNNFDLGITPENVIAINDVMKGIDKERHRYTTDLRSDFTGKV